MNLKLHAGFRFDCSLNRNTPNQQTLWYNELDVTIAKPEVSLREDEGRIRFFSRGGATVAKIKPDRLEVGSVQ